MKKLSMILPALLLFWMASLCPAQAQMQAGLSMTPMGYCQIPAASLASAAGLNACVSGSFTGTCSGTPATTLTVSALAAGDIGTGWTVSGTGMPTGTTILNQQSGSPGGVGVYTVSQPCTSSGASLTTIGPPVGANAALLQAETQNIRWRDDGGTPTTSVGMLLLSAQPPAMYTGTLSALKFIDATAGGLLDVAFYKSSSP